MRGFFRRLRWRIENALLYALGKIVWWMYKRGIIDFDMILRVVGRVAKEDEKHGD